MTPSDPSPGPSRLKHFIFGPPSPRRVFLLIALVVFGTGAFYAWRSIDAQYPAIWRDLLEPGILGGVLLWSVPGVLFPVLLLVLLFAKNLTTHTVRDGVRMILQWPLLIGIAINLVFLAGALVDGLTRWVAGGGPPGIEFAARLGMELAPLVLMVAVYLQLTIIMPPMLAFAMPSNFLSIIPLVLGWLFCFNPYVILAGFWFPPHRRMKAYWKPARLPRLPRAGRGLTLIELLIDIALLAILSVGIAHGVSVAHRSAERQERWRNAIELAEDAIAHLRAQDSLPDPGMYRVDDDVARLHPDLAPAASVEIAPGPDLRLRQIRVTVRLDSELDRRAVSLACLAPAAAPPKEVQP